MIVSERFLCETYKIVRPSYFQSSYARIVCGWIIEYWEIYKTNPGKDIQSIYEQKRISIREDDDIDNISDFLQNLSKEWEDYVEIQNIDYAVKTSVHYLKLRSLSRLKERLEEAVMKGDYLKGERAVVTYERVEQPIDNGITLLKKEDTSKIIEAFTNHYEELFCFPSALGEVVGTFAREDLVSYLAFTGRGKTWFQLYTGITACTYGLKVVFFSLEMSLSQMIRRAWQSISGYARKDEMISCPYFSRVDEEDDKWEIKYRDIETKLPDLQSIEEIQRKSQLHFRSGNMKIIALPAYSATVDDLRVHLDNLEYYENYIPDIVIVDYADNIISNIRGEYRHQLDSIWKSLKGLAQERNVMVVTASQANKQASKKDADEENVAEDIRKLAHVSKMISINQTKDEAKKSYTRIKLLKERDGRSNYSQAVVLQCLDIGKVYIDSRIKKDVYL